MTHVAIDGTTSCYQYRPERKAWVIWLGETPVGFAFGRDEAKMLAENAITKHDEHQLELAYQFVKWANECWPGMDKEGIIDTVVQHIPGACRQALVEVLKRGLPD